VRDFWTEQGPTDVLLKFKEERNNSVQSGGTVERDAADAFKLSDIDVAN
jgi:hypothetical protein